MWEVWKKGDLSQRSIKSQPTRWEGEKIMSNAQKKLIEISQKDLELQIMGLPQISWGMMILNSDFFPIS